MATALQMLSGARVAASRRCWWSALALLCLCLLTITTTASAASVKATVDRPVVTLGETLTLSLALEGAQAQQPSLPAMPNISVVGQGASMQMSLGGAVQQTFNYVLSPTQAGDLVIPSMRFNVGGQVITTDPIPVKVLPPGASAGGAPPLAFARIVLAKTNLYVGEVVDIEVQVYFQEGRITQYPQLPADPGFTLGKWLQPSQSRIAVSNVAYNLVTFKAPLTAVKAGALSLGPATQPIIVPDRSRRQGFFFSNEREIRAIAEKRTAIALPLPTNNVPVTFAGAVGQFSATMQASPTNVAVGDPLTVRIRITGRGWLDSVTIPPQPHWRGFKTYSPNARIESGDVNNINGTKSFEMAVVPQDRATQALPALMFSFFDPEARAYRTVSTAPIPLSISAGSTPAAPLPRLTATNTSEAPPPTDIAHIKQRLGSATASKPVLTQPWFIALQFVAPALWLGLVLRRKRREALANNPALRRRREVEAFVRSSLDELRAHAQARRDAEFFRTLFRILQESIGERIDVPATAVTESIVDERLRPAGLADEGCRLLHELFQAANLARFAPSKSGQELASYVPKIEQAVAMLQQWRRQP